MILHRKCPICKSDRLIGFALDTHRKGPHISRVQCAHCNLVFANPMADEAELSEYYQSYYEQENYEAIGYKNHIENHFERISNLNASQIKSESRFLKELGGGH